MCRLLVHWGAPVPVADSVVHAPHSLLRQCTEAREQSSGCTNPDGWGIGWWVDDQPDAYRYRSAAPMPDDHEGVAALDGLEAGRWIAHVRHKSPGSPTEIEGNAPFASGRWLFAHNGFVADYRDGVRDELLARLSPARRAALRSDADSEVLFGLVLDAIDDGASPSDALASIVGPLADRGGRYNIALADGDELLVTRADNSLYRRGDASALEIASEPYDDGADWRPVPDRTLLHLDAGGLELTSF